MHRLGEDGLQWKHSEELKVEAVAVSVASMVAMPLEFKIGLK